LVYNLTEKVNDVAVSSSGSVILFGGEDQYAYAMNKSGAILWEYKTRGNVLSVGLSDNSVSALVASGDNYVYSFRNTSKVLPETTYYKRYRLGKIKAMDVSSSGYGVVAGAEYDENVTEEGSYRQDYIYHLNGNAEVISKFETERDVTTVSISTSGSTAAGISDDELFVNGRIIEMGWLYTFDYLEILDTSDSAVVVGNTNNVYYVSGYTVRWIYNTTQTLDVAISDNNRVLVGSDRVVMLDSAMNEVWSYNISYNALKVAISRSGNVAAVFFDNRYLYVFDGSGNVKWRYFTGDRIVSMKIAPTEDYIVAGSYSGRVYLFRI
jgi:WD40 repeat protein